MKLIRIYVEVKAPLATVWKCFTLPQHITQWNFAHPSWRCPMATNPLEVGAKFVWRMEAVDGSAGFDYSGTYLEIVPEKKLVYQLEDLRKVRVEFEEIDGRVRINEQFEGLGNETDAQQREGWKAILNHFKAYTESV